VKPKRVQFFPQLNENTRYRYRGSVAEPEPQYFAGAGAEIFGFQVVQLFKILPIPSTLKRKNCTGTGTKFKNNFYVPVPGKISNFFKNIR
jgi:hypothetical protein